MKQRRGFDEVMIINPHDPAMGAGEHVMFGFSPAGPLGFGAFPEPGAMAYYNEYPGMGWVGGPGLGAYGDAMGYGAAEPIGYYAAEPLSGYGEWPLGFAGYSGPVADPYGGYAQYAEPFFGEYPLAEPFFGDWGEPSYGADPMGEYGEPYAEAPYGEPYAEGPYGDPYAEPMYGDPYAEPMYGEGYGDISDYGAGEMPGWGDPSLGGYVRDVPSPFNAGCPLPTNVNGLEDVGLEGYQKPRQVSPTVTAFTAADAVEATPEAFRPLW